MSELIAMFPSRALEHFETLVSLMFFHLTVALPQGENLEPFLREVTLVIFKLKTEFETNRMLSALVPTSRRFRVAKFHNNLASIIGETLQVILSQFPPAYHVQIEPLLSSLRNYHIDDT